jgi:hypothetical protein
MVTGRAKLGGLAHALPDPVRGIRAEQQFRNFDNDPLKI